LCIHLHRRSATPGHGSRNGVQSGNEIQEFPRGPIFGLGKEDAAIILFVVNEVHKVRFFLWSTGAMGSFKSEQMTSPALSIGECSPLSLFDCLLFVCLPSGQAMQFGLKWSVSLITDPTIAANISTTSWD
jgi:hypothetical protein